jgi:hypothetical protein
MVSSGLLRRVALVITDVSEEPGASFIKNLVEVGDMVSLLNGSSLALPFDAEDGDDIFPPNVSLSQNIS